MSIFTWWANFKHRRLATAGALFALAVSLQIYVMHVAEVKAPVKREAIASVTSGKTNATNENNSLEKARALPEAAMNDGSPGRQPAVSRADLSHRQVILMARVIEGEAADEPYLGKVAVGAVIVNRMESNQFPKTLEGVIYQDLAFEAVANGQMHRPLTKSSIRAAEEALNGRDPTGGALYYWNPYKKVSNWVWSRPICTQIGRHVFAH